METLNIRLDIEYDGTDFMGWQRQPHGPTVQAYIEDVIRPVVGRRVVVFGASRTDSGVHAEGQVAHFCCTSRIPPDRWVPLLNTQLPRTIRIQKSRSIAASFHAQKQALSKVYEYRILNRPAASALDRRVLFYRHPLNWGAIQDALPLFVGERDFRGFQCAGSQVKSTVRTIHAIDLFADANGLYRFRIWGSGFLKQMVRTILGTLLEIGEGKRTQQSIEAVFQTGNRCLAGRTISPEGLCLVSIQYPDLY